MKLTGTAILVDISVREYQDNTTLSIFHRFHVDINTGGGMLMIYYC